MANRPWLTPQELIGYTDYDKVIQRKEPKLATDITRAETYIIHRTNNDFSDEEKYPIIPPDVKLATMLIAEFYAAQASTDPNKTYQSETFKDYSYTVSSSSDKKIEDIDITALIADHTNKLVNGTLDMKLRKL